MRFEWNPLKSAENLKKHRVSFEEAATVFYDPLAATFPDPDHSVGEVRMITVGSSSRELCLSYAILFVEVSCG